MDFTYRIEIDDDHTPWGNPSVVEEETAKIETGEWAPYGVIVCAVGPVEAEQSVWGCVVPTTLTGTFTELDKIQDAHLRSVAKECADEIAGNYRAVLLRKRDEIDAALSQPDAQQ